MKILVVNPPAATPFIREGRCMQIRSSWAALWMPLSLAYVAAVLRDDGHQILLVDAIAEELDREHTRSLARDFAPDFIFLNTAFPTLESDRDFSAELKSALPHAPIALLGMLPTLLDEQALALFASADYAIGGEPEWAAPELVKTHSTGGSLAGVKGLVWRKGEGIAVNPPQDLAAHDLDELPFPARDLLPIDAYRLPLLNQRFTLLSIGRGCPHSCIYCAAPAYYGARFRKRLASRIADEIQECVERHGIRHFLFWGESFTGAPGYGESICDEILRRNLRVVWSTTSRVDTLNPSLLAKMKQAGCKMLGLGIESSNQEILDRAQKHIRVDQILDAIEMLRAAGVRSMGHFVFGLPGETRETAAETIRFALRSHLDFAQFYCAVPYPKTALGKWAVERGGMQSQSFSSFDLTRSILHSEFLSPDEVKAFRDQAYRRFYFRPRMFARILGEISSVPRLLDSMDFLRWIRK